MVYETAETVNSYEGNEHEKKVSFEAFPAFIVAWCMHSSLYGVEVLYSLFYHISAICGQ